eukprot:TRINITY_DN8530_c0_g1_i1.p1 TRINITY_DN8530_c0_g1~~TRINITY_DN8530_c0_g1_i1.p1  ORF type:complete len:174 (+),score=19.25 TRINITY_DN8530_c0_g1_i1:44-565(+)
MPQRPIVTVYPHSSYNEQQKDARPEKDSSVASRMARFKQQYAERGMRRSVEAVLLTYQHNHPHIYLLQMNSSLHKLPGGRLRQGEDEEEGLLRKLHDKLGPDTGMSPEWSIAGLLSTWWRPAFDTNFYPYVPPHITEPKECKKIYLVQLPERFTLHVPRNFKLIKGGRLHLHS